MGEIYLVALGQVTSLQTHPGHRLATHYEMYGQFDQPICQGRKLSFMPNIIDMELDQRYLKLTDFVCNQYTIEILLNHILQPVNQVKQLHKQTNYSILHFYGLNLEWK